MELMNDQMALLPTAARKREGAPGRPARSAGPSWELDEHTRTVGKQGLAAARAALQQACARTAA